MKRWLHTAARRDVVYRSLRVSVVVGTILIGINYTDRLISGQCIGADYLKMALTYLVPYGVSTYASVSALLKDKLW
ncbi:nitrate/nitrite transporter NrtS [Candidatus Poribacteria bacterium]|nr:nitrate/nitrite transporter NrtS [Candidatus Poribacteria bacterium]